MIVTHIVACSVKSVFAVMIQIAFAFAGLGLCEASKFVCFVCNSDTILITGNQGVTRKIQPEKLLNRRAVQKNSPQGR